MKVLFPLLGLLSVTMLAVSPTGDAKGNLLKNPSLEIDPGSSTIPGWKLTPPGTGVENSEEMAPEGASTVLMVTVSGVSESHGQLVQRLKVVPGDRQTLTVSGWVMSELAGAAYIQVKLYKEGSEIARIDIGSSGGSQWKQVSQPVDPGEADAIEILCRWHQQGRNEGKRVGFAGISAIPESGQAP